MCPLEMCTASVVVLGASYGQRRIGCPCNGTARIGAVTGTGTAWIVNHAYPASRIRVKSPMPCALDGRGASRSREARAGPGRRSKAPETHWPARPLDKTATPWPYCQAPMGLGSIALSALASGSRPSIAAGWGDGSHSSPHEWARARCGATWCAMWLSVAGGGAEDVADPRAGSRAWITTP